MTKVRRFLAVLLVLALGAGVAACGSDSDSGSGEGSEASAVEGVTWQAMNLVTQGAATSLPKGVKPPTLEINDGQASIFAGCNSGSGEATVNEATIDFGPIALTRKSCEQVQNQIEFLVTQVLQGEVKYEVNSDGNLILEKGTDSIVYTKG
ncbi:MAG TPA: META domain-containing protein [Solirubrobacterales bacterium]|nr:META domain-containing protein [Solirubrobacterales bacterium]